MEFFHSGFPFSYYELHRKIKVREIKLGTYKTEKGLKNNMIFEHLAVLETTVFIKICHANMCTFNLIKADFQVDWMTTQLNSFQNMLILSRGGEHVLLTLQNWFGLPNRSHQ